MAYLTDGDKIRSVLMLTTNQLTDANCRDAMASACSDLKDWIGTSTYAAVLTTLNTKRSGLSEGENLEEDGNLTDQEQKLRDAETFLAVAYLYPSMNLIFSAPGIQTSVVTEKGQMNALTPTQIAIKVKEYRKRAHLKAYDWLETKAVSGGGESGL